MGVASNQSIIVKVASCGSRMQKQVGILRRRYECGGLIRRGTYLRMPGTSTSSASTKTGSRMFTLRNVQKGRACSGRLGSSLFEASGSSHGFKAGPVLNPSLFLTKVAYLLSS